MSGRKTAGTLSHDEELRVFSECNRQSLEGFGKGNTIIGFMIFKDLCG